MPIPTLTGIRLQMIETERLNMHVLTSSLKENTPVLFIHGNVSSATFWQETMLQLPAGYRGIAPDLRGYGDTEPLPIDGTLGLEDRVADVRALVEEMGLGRYHLMGHSMGGELCYDDGAPAGVNPDFVRLLAEGERDAPLLLQASLRARTRGGVADLDARHARGRRLEKPEQFNELLHAFIQAND